MLPEREAKLSDEALEARALAYLEGSVAMNALAEKDCNSPAETEQFYKLGKELWIKHTQLSDTVKERKNGQRTRASRCAVCTHGSGAGASAAHG